MSQMTQTTKSNDIALLLNFPETGEILAGNKVLETDTRYKNSIFKYRVTFDKDVRRSDIPNTRSRNNGQNLRVVNSFIVCKHRLLYASIKAASS